MSGVCTATRMSSAGFLGFDKKKKEVKCQTFDLFYQPFLIYFDSVRIGVEKNTLENGRNP